MTEKQRLETGWTLRNCVTGQSFDTEIPGSVYETWLDHGAMEDPYWRDNEDSALKLMEDDYEYRTVTGIDEALLECDEIWLRFEGIDTLADIYFNGCLLGKTDNMHRTWEYPVKSLVKEENEICVSLHSPTAYIRNAFDHNPYDGSPESMQGFPHLRKTHCSFGWDWGPRLPDMGMFRETAFIGARKARLTGVSIRQSHGNGFVDLHIVPEVESLEKNGFYFLEVHITDPDGRAVVNTDLDLDRKTVVPPDPDDAAEAPDPAETVRIVNPKLWWPNGYGGQPLYRVEAVLKSGEETIGSWSGRIGLRTMTVNTNRDSYGSRFAHQVNGVEIFAMGADYIPEDCLRGRTGKERTKRLLEQCRECNFNVIRVWGGGYYPDNYFYDICDELGLLVWQDFMFACGVYHLSPEFEETVSAEIRDNVKRIRHHACLGLWCGNNEMEMFIASNQWIRKPAQKTEYLILSQRLIPELLKKYDPDTFYWPSSPSSGGDFDRPDDPDRGDSHYWDVWHGGAPFTEYRRFFFRYLSEFGFQSFPSVKTIEAFTEPEDRNVFSYVMEKHQRNSGANGKILQYMSQMYRYPESLDQLVYVSQLLQAEAIRYGAEHFRRNRGRCMGCVYWQLNDCWPVASWSSIDYFGRWKALHYFARRFFAPVLLSCEERGALTSSMDVNEEGRSVEKAARFFVTNETRKTVRGLIKWSLRNNRSEILRDGEFTVCAKALSAAGFPWMEFPDVDERESCLSYELWLDGKMVSYGTSLFVQPKHFRFLNPRLKVWAEGEEIVVKAETFAKGIEIRNTEADLLLSDNFFDMNAGVRRIRVLEGRLDGLSVRSIYEAGR